MEKGYAPACYFNSTWIGAVIVGEHYICLIEMSNSKTNVQLSTSDRQSAWILICFNSTNEWTHNYYLFEMVGITNGFFKIINRKAFVTPTTSDRQSAWISMDQAGSAWIRLDQPGSACIVYSSSDFQSCSGWWQEQYSFLSNDRNSAVLATTFDRLSVYLHIFTASLQMYKCELLLALLLNACMLLLMDSEGADWDHKDMHKLIGTDSTEGTHYSCGFGIDWMQALSMTCWRLSELQYTLCNE